MQKTFKIETLGCKTNQYDSQRLHEMLESAGLSPASSRQTPDVWIINTCTVTHTADRKARRLIRQKKRDMPHSKVFVTGCFAEMLKTSKGGASGADGVYNYDEWDLMVRRLRCPGRRNGPSSARNRDFGLRHFRGRHRAFIKIQDGCDSHCSYCRVAHVRGRPRSRPLKDALDEGRRLIDEGFCEIVLTGIHLGLYGRDLPGMPDLADAVGAFAGLDPGIRIRLSSLEGPEADGKLLAAMTASNVCAHLHLPLQSGDADVLKRMRRSYDPGKYFEVLQKIRTTLENPAISTDVIVGFPGETDQAFRNTLQFCEEAGFSRIHVFHFSPRPGTPACDMDRKVAPSTARQRSRELRNLAERLQIQWASTFTGQRLRVLCETEKNGWMTGYSDRYVRVSAPAQRQLIGRLCNILITGRKGCKLLGQPE